MAHPRIFVSYSHADSKQKDRLLKHLTPLQDSAEFDVWTDSGIAVGEKWEPAIEKALSTASIAILLITADFLSSDFVRHKEIPVILQRREKEDLRLYPILAKPCAWQAVPWINETQLRPVAAKPVWRTAGRYADDELARIALELLAIIQLAIRVQEAADDAARQKAEQEKREKEQEIADAITSSPAVEFFYPPERNEFLEATRDSTKIGTESVESLDLGDRHHVELNSDRGEAQKIYSQIVADRAKFSAERWQALQDLQTKVFGIMQDVTANKSKTQEAAFKKWDEYIRSS
jgi:hypothetical protein